MAKKNRKAAKTPAAAEPPPPEEKTKKAKKEPIRGWLADWTFNILLLLFGTTTLVQAFVVPTSSMEGTILIGDHLLVDKLAYSPYGPISKWLLPYSDVKRGDIIVFRYPLDLRTNYVKRVVAIPGDRLRIVNRQLYVNGKPLAEPYKRHIRKDTDSYLDFFPSVPSGFRVYPPAEEMLRDNVENQELVVPPGKYFAMGDNRDNSLDGRFWGFVPRENIVGKPIIILWSFDTSTEKLAKGTLNPEFLVDFALHFFTKTRWTRCLTLLKGYPLQ